jgi:small nuclear ribonucleoprotein (snRNP)-like protein
MEDKFNFECEDNDTLAQILHRLQHHIIDVIVLGGWLYTGKLVEVEEEEAILCDVTVTSSGGLTLSTFEVGRVTIRLDTIISFGKPSRVL